MTTQNVLEQAGMTQRRSQRLRLILERLAGDDSIDHHEISTELGISIATTRRDLAFLEQQGYLIRTHGGARHAPNSAEIPVRFRASLSSDEKLAIAATAASLVGRGRGAVAVSGGSTAAEVARQLAFRHELTIVTNALTTVSELLGRGHPRVMVTGGMVRTASHELVGSIAEHTFNAINVQTAILGADGVSAIAGVTTHDEVEARTNRAMVLHAQRVIVVADHAKLDKAAFAHVAALSEITTLVTDDGADPAALSSLRAEGVEVIVVPVVRTTEVAR